MMTEPMKISDFRIGNYITGQDGSYAEHIIIDIQEKAIISRPPGVYDWVSSFPVSDGDSSALPIALTNNWFKRLGFKDKQLSLTPFMDLSFRSGMFFININGGYTALHHIKYVHQVQNLYHSLTGQELIIIN